MILSAFTIVLLAACESTPDVQSLEVKLDKGDHVVLIGNNLCSRMMLFGHFETRMHQHYPEHELYIRNMCDGGNTPGFRPHPGRESPWAFPGAEVFQTELANNSGSVGHFESPDEWLSRLRPDIMLAFFGFSTSFNGAKGVETYKNELRAFVDHSLSQEYSDSELQLVLISPTAIEDISDHVDVPDGVETNRNLALYRDAMREVANEKAVPFLDVFEPSKAWYDNESEDLTIDGMQLNDRGYSLLSDYLVTSIFGGEPGSTVPENTIHEAVMEKNWFWHNDFKIPNGVHVFGRRYEPFGPDNYPDELIKIREMTAIRDTAIWMTTKGISYDMAAADSKTHTLPPVESNYKPSEKNGNPRYLYGEEALNSLEVPPGYKIELFASEKEFEDLANPVQISFDNQGRLWVAVMPTYPHYRPGDAKPNDKLIILEDTDGDGKADKQTTFAENLHLPIGFEIAPEGVYMSQGTNLVLLKDHDKDDRADEKIVLLSGFDDHDTHHGISAYCADPSGAIIMGEGVFLHSNVETAYGTIRGTNGGFFRYDPKRHKLERHAQVSIPNPWGIAFDDWGQHFFAETSGPDVRWMMPGSVKPRYGVFTHKGPNLIEDEHRVRPTSGLEFMSSRHFPDEVQGDLMINNTIGFLGTKQHKVSDDGTGFTTLHRQDLVKGADKNFRPVDMEIAPDGSLYMIDWHNVLIGHMQHNARDPYRDHVHGRVYRVTYPSRPLVRPAFIHEAPIDTLLENLKLPEYRTRYRTRRELRGRPAGEVLTRIQSWVSRLDKEDPNYEHHLVEALWVTWGLNDVDESILRQVMEAENFRARAAAVRVLRYAGDQIPNSRDLLKKAAADEAGRVRLEAIVAASWLGQDAGLSILDVAKDHPLDDWMLYAYNTSYAHLNGRSVDDEEDDEAPDTDLTGNDLDLYLKGKEIYSREGFCMTCHQADGKGLVNSGFPPLAGTKWVLESEERLIKITLKGLFGPIEVLGREYPGQVPMTPYEGMLNDEEIAAVLTYVRNAFGNKADPVSSASVARVRSEIQSRSGFYNPEELLQEHPHEVQ